MPLGPVNLSGLEVSVFFNCICVITKKAITIPRMMKNEKMISENRIDIR
jgi:hypothetical protein